MADGSLQMNQMQQFAPDAESARDLRHAMGKFGTGVTVITAMTDAGPIGMTANSFSSVSLDPALVLWCPAKSSGRYAHFIGAKHFAIHVMGVEHADIAMGFARSGAAFDGLDIAVNAQGVPLLGQCLARFECETQDIHDAGDHSIVVAQVHQAAFREGDALIFCEGRFGQFDKDV
ncbi:flavin reductase family protein [uncultured Roseobacter sp.]|uniref:flavin reductase family protein n=1 Tax=uncultured Roseobacter sp. TaxID=114847 RepID=UPI00262792D1|nr:flavin reductase family protein [uncultured Roseobacter sp.]